VTHRRARRYPGALDPATGRDPSRPLSEHGEGALPMALLNRGPAWAVWSDVRQLAPRPQEGAAFGGCALFPYNYNRINGMLRAISGRHGMLITC
jgi:hypothetical protein